MLEFFDGLSPYGAIEELEGRWIIPTLDQKSLVAEASFPTGRALSITAGATSASTIRMPVSNPSSEIIAGCYIIAPGAVGTRQISVLTFFNAAGELLGGLRASEDGVFVVDSGGNQLGIVDAVPSAETHYEIKMLFSDDEEVGMVEVRVNEEVAFTFTGVTSTRSDQNCALVGTVGNLGGALLTSWTLRTGHFHVIVPDASPTGDFLGVASIGYLVPVADELVEWTPDSGGDNFARVDEDEADGDTSYVTAGPNNSMDLYRMEDLTALDPLIYGVNLHTIQRLAAPGSRILRHIAAIEGEYDYEYDGLAVDAGPDHNIVSTDYESRVTLLVDNPFTAAPWTHDEINSLVAGMELNP